jgi:glycosyltransferase involved in cell wall biosynthesis
MRDPAILGIVSYKVFPARMGGQKCISGFYGHLSEHTKVVLAASKENKDLTGVPYAVLPFLFNHWKALLNVFYIHRLREIIQQQHIDVICIEHSYFAWMGVWLKRLTKIPFVIRSHNIEAHRFRDMRRIWWSIYEWYEKNMHRKADHNFFITEEDRQWGIQQWQLQETKCSVATYGTGPLETCTIEQRKDIRYRLLHQYNIPEKTRLFLFNGTLDYLPNTDALRIIINEIVPMLRAADYPFHIFICGKGLDEQWVQVLKTCPELVFTGFVEDINLYYDGIDCFINPVTLGGGIRTKLVEALSHNQSAISTRSGAHGIDSGITGGKLTIVNDYDWHVFTAAMMQPDLPVYATVPDLFHQTFNWDGIVRKALLSLQIV